MADFNGLPVRKLRVMMRKRFPVTKGAFSSVATREQCLKVLSGKETAEAVIDGWMQEMQHTSVGFAEGPAEGVHGDGAGDAPAPSSDTPEGKLAAVQRLLRAADKDDLAAYIGDAVRKAAEATDLLNSFDRGTDGVVSDKGTTKVAGIDCPIMAASEADHPERHAVPGVAKGYRFDYWQASRKCGALTFQQTAADLLRLVCADERVLLVGPPATGKTSVIEQYAARVGWPVTRFNGNRDVTMHDFVGTMTAHSGATHWVDGPLPRAMKGGHILILDEVDHMPAECSSVLHSVLEPGGMLQLQHEAQGIAPHPDFRIIATANTAGFGDESGLHPNAQVQDAAFLSRFGVVFRVDYMNQAHERDLLRKHAGIEKSDAETIVKIAHDTRKAAEQHQLMYPITLRQTMAWAKMGRVLDWGTCFAITVLNKLPDQDVAAVAEIAQRHLGNRLGGSIVD